MSRRDLEFLLFEWLDTEALLARPRFAEHDRDTVESVLDLAESIATTHFAPHNRAADLEEPRFDGTTVHLLPEVGKADLGLLGIALDNCLFMIPAWTGGRWGTQRQALKW